MVESLQRPLATRPDEPLNMKAQQLGQLDKFDLLVKSGLLLAMFAHEIVNKFAADKFAETILQQNGRAHHCVSHWKAQGYGIKHIQMKRIFVVTIATDKMVGEDATGR